MRSIIKKIFLSAAPMLLVASLSFGQSESKLPTDKNAGSAAAQPIRGWRTPAESERQSYEVSLDTTVRHGGNAGASIKSKLFADGDERKTVYLMQTIKGDNYYGKKLRLSAFVKSENVERAALWMRMDGDEMKVLNLDAMDDRPLSGTADWQRYDIILDVPDGTRQIIFGVNLKGNGRIWIDDVKLEEVGSDIPGTSSKTPAEWEKASAKRIEQYKLTNKEDYAAQLRAFGQRNAAASPIPINLDFEN